MSPPDPLRAAATTLLDTLHAYNTDDGRTSWKDVAAASSEARAALAADTAPLDAAWAAVVSALPDGWHIAALASDGHENPGWFVEARSAMVGGKRIAASGPTPAAVLRALAARLAETP